MAYVEDWSRPHYDGGWGLESWHGLRSEVFYRMVYPQHPLHVLACDETVRQMYRVCGGEAPEELPHDSAGDILQEEGGLIRVGYPLELHSFCKTRPQAGRYTRALSEAVYGLDCSEFDRLKPTVARRFLEAGGPELLLVLAWGLRPSGPMAEARREAVVDTVAQLF